MKPLLLPAVLCLLAPALVAQSSPTVATSDIPASVRFLATRANSPPGSCGCFWLTGGGADAALPLAKDLHAVVEVAGTTTQRVPASSRGLSVLTLMAGPRYTLPLARAALHGQFLIGAARGFDSDFVTVPAKADTATVLAFSAGAAVDVPLSHDLSVRALQVEFLQTSLPNGVDNRQRNLRIGAGIVLHVHLPASSR